MKKICIITLNGYFNLGNRLQNFALSYFLESFDYNVFTYWNRKHLFKSFLKLFMFFSKKYNREKNIMFFSKKYIKETCKLDKFDYYVFGSDQIWNPVDTLKNDMLLGFNIKSENKIAYAASFGVSDINPEYYDYYKEGLSKFKIISVREDQGKNILENYNILNIPVVLDPTMLLTSDEWDRISVKPKWLKNERFILNYFLGELSEEKKNEIERIANENGCEIINILDKNSPFYECGPSEFLWLEKNAFLICTDSFHSSVFAILYNRPFVIFDREQEGVVSMNSRLETLLSKFNLKNRKFEGKITEENLNHDYSEAYKILKVERQKSKDFLERALDIKK